MLKSLFMLAILAAPLQADTFNVVFHATIDRFTPGLGGGAAPPLELSGSFETDGKCEVCSLSEEILISGQTLTTTNRMLDILFINHVTP